MQQSSDFFLEIGRILPADETMLVLAALRHDPLVWQSLEGEDFFKIALEQAGSQASSWTPGRLALLAMEEQRPAETLRAEPLTALSQALQERALQAYQNIQRTGKPPATLREAGLLALAMRERRRLTGTWSGLLQEIFARQKSSDGLFQVWRTPLACLYALVPDPTDMLRGLLPKTQQSLPFEWIIYAQLCQPVNDAEHAQALMQVLQNLPVVYQLNLLRNLSLHGRENIAADLASHILVGHPAFANLRMQANKQEHDLAALASRSLALQQMGAFYQLAADRNQALSLYNAAEITLDQWRAGLYLQRLNLQMNQEMGDTLVLMESSQLSHLTAAAGWLKNELGAVLVSHPYASSIMDQVAGDNDSCFVQLKRASQMFEREPAVARDLARQGAAGLLQSMRQQGVPFIGDYVYTWRPEDALGILLDLDLPEDALAIAQTMLDVRPVDIHLLHLTSQIMVRLGRPEEAMRYARMIVVLDSSGPEWRRLLANLLGQVGQWENAWNEWQVVLSLYEKPNQADRLACANAAFFAGRLDHAIRMSEDILREDDNHGAALGLLGQALVGKGEKRQAISYLVRATLLAP